jgi:hypothetical protein
VGESCSVRLAKIQISLKEEILEKILKIVTIDVREEKDLGILKLGIQERFP